MAVLLGHFLAVAMAWSPSLHRWVHGDADEPDHQCCVTAVIDGQMDTPDVAIIFTAPEVPRGEIAAVIDFSCELPPLVRACAQERAPPAA